MPAVPMWSFISREAMATDTRSTWKSWCKWSSSSWIRTLIVIALRWGSVGRTGRRSRSLVPHMVIQLLVKEQHLDFGRRCRAKRTSTAFFSVYRGLRFRSSLEGLTWPKFISCMVRERSATCSSWAGAATVWAVSSTMKTSNARSHAPRSKFVLLESSIRISGQRTFCGTQI